MLPFILDYNWSIKQVWYWMVPSALNHLIGRYILCCTWHIELSNHYLLNWKQLNVTIYHQQFLLLLGSQQVWNLPIFCQYLLLLLGSSTGLEVYLLHSKQQCPLFLIFDNNLYSILDHLPYLITISDTHARISGVRLISQIDMTSNKITLYAHNIPPTQSVKTTSLYYCYQRQTLSYSGTIISNQCSNCALFYCTLTVHNAYSY